MIIASPWTRGGWVNSQLFDHTSTLMFLEHFAQSKYGKTVTEENISPWRRCISGDLTSIFRPDHVGEARLDYLDRNKFVVSIQRARYRETPSNSKKLTLKQIEDINNNPLRSTFKPHQETGIRPSCALPYELYADGGLSTDGNKFVLRMRVGNAVHGERSMGAPFNVYLRNTSTGSNARQNQTRVATYTVRSGDTLEEEFPLMLFANRRYLLDVHGPNGFYRSFAGDSQERHVRVQTAYENHGSGLTGNVQLGLENTGERTLAITAQDHSYGTAPVARELAPREKITIVLNSKRSHGWYDFSVKAANSTAISRFAGRVETGRPSFSDPLMGGILAI